MYGRSGPARIRAIHATALTAATLLGLALQWPSLTSGFKGDDYVQSAMLNGTFPGPRSPLDLFSFVAGTPDDYRRLSEFGFVPWWGDPQLRLRMWRPLASALIAADFQVFGQRAWLFHVHSLLWFVLLLWAASRALFRWLPPSAASVSLLLFASAPCHTLPVGWLANRSTLLGCFFAFCALAWQSAAHGVTSSPRRKLAVMLTTVLALACGEYGLCALAYALAFVWFRQVDEADEVGERTTLRKRAAEAWPLLLPIALYLALHSLVGSDIVFSGFYVSPIGSPWAFTQAALTRVPVLAADLLFGLPSYQFNSGSPWRQWLLTSGLVPLSVWPHLPEWRTWHVLIGYVALAFGVLAWRLLRNTTVRPPTWSLIGAVAALLPCAGSLPEDRLLTAASLGSCALLGSLLTGAAFGRWRDLAVHERVARVAVSLLALWAGVSGLARSYSDIRSMAARNEMTRALCLDADLPVHGAETARVYIVAAPEFNTAVNLPWLRLLERGLPLPRSYRRLSPSAWPIDITRTSDRVLEVRTLTNAVRGSALPSLYRAATAPMRTGEQHTLSGLTVTVLDVFDDNPTRMRFEFDRSLDDSELHFLIASEHGLRRHKLPAIGETERLPFAQYADMRAHQSTDARSH